MWDDRTSQTRISWGSCRGSPPSADIPSASLRRSRAVPSISPYVECLLGMVRVRPILLCELHARYVRKLLSCCIQSAHDALDCPTMSHSNLQTSYATVVAGAGPAGVMAAFHAAARGTVLLVDGSALPRDKSCGGMLNEYTQHFLAEFGEMPASMTLDPQWV